MSVVNRIVQRQAKDVYKRITLNWITLSFFLFSFIHCFAQGIIQSFLYSLDADYQSLTSGIVAVANISNKVVPHLTGSPGSFDLQICDDVPFYFPETCHSVSNELPQITEDTSALEPLRRRVDPSQSYTLKGVPSNVSEVLDVLITSENGDSLILNHRCTETLVYLRQMKTRREDVTWICLQFWLLSISLIAIITDSIPHILTVLAARTLATAWAAYAVWRNHHRWRVTDELFTRRGTACSINMLPRYLEIRGRLEIPELILNCTALVVAAYLSSTLLKVYSRQSFRFVGAPKPITHMQKFFLAVLSVLQLEVFVVLVAMALWIDELSNGPIARVSDHSTIYRGGVIFTAVTLWPWIALGWYSIRKEHRVGIYLFMGFAFGLTFAWCFMFYSQVYRWTYSDWPYFGCYATASLLLLLSSFIFALICRINFGKGLKQYMQAESAVSSSGIQPDIFAHDVQKGGFHITKDGIVDDNPFSDKHSVLPTSSPPNIQIPLPTRHATQLSSVLHHVVGERSLDPSLPGSTDVEARPIAQLPKLEPLRLV